MPTWPGRLPRQARNHSCQRSGCACELIKPFMLLDASTHRSGLIPLSVRATHADRERAAVKPSPRNRRSARLPLLRVCRKSMPRQSIFRRVAGWTLRAVNPGPLFDGSRLRGLWAGRRRDRTCASPLGHPCQDPACVHCRHLQLRKQPIDDDRRVCAAIRIRFSADGLPTLPRGLIRRQTAPGPLTISRSCRKAGLTNRF